MKWPEPLMTAAEVAEVLRLGVGTVYEWAERSPPKIKAVRLGRSLRFHRAEVERIMAEGVPSRAAR